MVVGCPCPRTPGRGDLAPTGERRLIGKHQRRSLRLPNYDYAQPGAYFFTAVSYKRSVIFADEVIYPILMDTWLAIPPHFQGVTVDEFVIMPNHVHGIVIIEDSVGAGSPRPHESQQYKVDGVSSPTLGQIISYFKYKVAKQINIYRETASAPVWQRNYHEHVIRNEAELSRIREYIKNNPTRWDLDRENPLNQR